MNELIEKEIVSIQQQTSDDESVIVSVEPINGDKNKLQEIEEAIHQSDMLLADIDKKVDKLTNHADTIDYAVATASGVITGLIDAFFVGEFSLENAKNWGTEKIEKKVMEAAKKQNPDVNGLADSVYKLEEVKNPGDWVTKAFGNGDHHFYEFSHHKSPLGLICSLITQFTGRVYGIDAKTGVFKTIQISNYKCILVGKNDAEKIVCGVSNWVLHLLSDMCGTSDTILKGNYGTGIPGPIMSVLSEFASLRIFEKNGSNKFTKELFNLFNGGKLKDLDGNKYRLDYRMEKGMIHELSKQFLPVVLNECFVRIFYFVRRLITIIKRDNITKIKQLNLEVFKEAAPFNNRTIQRMLTIATSTMTAIDLADAAIRSGGTLAGFAVRVNYVGVVRCGIAVGTDVVSGIKRSNAIDERIKLINERTQLLNAKVAILNNGSWSQIDSTEESMNEIENIIRNVTESGELSGKTMVADMDNIGSSIEKMKESNLTTTEKMKKLLED